MKNLVRFGVLLFFAIPLILLAKELGPDVSNYKGQDLKWEEGARSYYVMFKSLLTNSDPSNDYSNGKYNPTADKCVDSATYKLEMSKIPLDAYVDRAFLIWSGNVPSAKLNQATGNEVTLAFKHEEGKIEMSEKITASRAAMLTDNQDFEFEGFRDDEGRGFFTYRVDVTNYFKMIHQKGQEAGIPYFGMSLYGDYTVSGVECSGEPLYLDKGVLVNGWTLLLVYTTIEVSPKKIYIYNGFQGYQHKSSIVNVTGFEFPDQPGVRMTLHVLEGDYGLINLDQAKGGSLTPESLKVQGDGDDWVQLTNPCNPLMQADNFGQPFYYSEIFNSVSSDFGYADVDPTCVGGTPPNIDTNSMEFGMDVDTFIMDAANDGQWAAHFYKGGTHIALDVSTNQDWIISNFMVVSVDTKAPKFDIPDNPLTPGGREKDMCSCAPEEDSVCLDTSFYYFIKVQNWGSDIATNVTVQDTLPGEVEYVPGSTQIATKVNAKDEGTDWTVVQDGSSPVFPLENPLKVADAMKQCTDGIGCDTVLIRFKVKPTPGLPKHTVITNTAIIKDSSGQPYSTNSAIPLRLRSGTCLSKSECEEPNLSKCGGNCLPGDPNCIDPGGNDADPTNQTNGAAVELKVGKNSPDNDNTSIIIKSPVTSLVVGQFTVNGVTSDGSKTKTFLFTDLKATVTEMNNEGITFTNLKLVYDENGNGVKDANEKEIGTADNVSGKLATFGITSKDQSYPANTLNHFLIVLDAAYNDVSVPANVTFKFNIIDKESVTVKDAAGTLTPTLPEGGVNFAKYMFEPTDTSVTAFIITKGQFDPPVPTKADINKDIAVLQIKTKAIGEAMDMTALTVKIPSGAVTFGDGLDSLSLWIDSNNDGVGEEKIADSPVVEKGATTAKFSIPDGKLSYTAGGDYKYLVIKAKFSMSNNDQKGKITIQKGGVLLSNTKAVIYELPLSSKEFPYFCDPADIICNPPVDGGEDCKCSIVSIDGAGGTIPTVLMLLTLALMFVLRETLLRKR